MLLKTLRIKALKAVKISPPRDGIVRLFAILHALGPDNSEPTPQVLVALRAGRVAVREMDVDADGRKQIDYWLEDGAGVGILID